MEALKDKNLDPLFVVWKNKTIDFMKAYQEQNVSLMLANCSTGAQVAFLPLGDQGKGNIHEVGKAIWSSLIDCFPSLNNTVHAVVEKDGSIRCEASVTGKHVKDFAGIPAKGHTFEEDHIFIFKMDESGTIQSVSVNWNHENLVNQLTKESDMGSRKETLEAIAKTYVEKGLGAGDFDVIPYDENIELRAPILPRGSENPMVGRSNIKENWWKPLPDLVERTELVDVYTNDALTAVTVEFYCHIKNVKYALRIVDKFEVSDEGKITKQENFFDPRDLTNPEWRQS